MAAHHHDAPLISMINKALRAIEADQHRRIGHRWLSDSHVINQQASTAAGLTAEQRVWLQDHPVIRVGVETDWAPYGFIDETGVYRGLSADYLQILGDALGVRFELIKGLSWQQIIAGLRDGRLDMSPALSYTREREDFLNFTLPIADNRLLIFTRDAETQINDLADLDETTGRKVAMIEGYSTETLIQARYPDMVFVYTTGLIDALRKVISGEADAYVGDAISVNYVLKEHNINGLKAVGSADLPQRGVRMAVRHELAPLAGLIDQTMASLDIEHHQKIRQNWLHSTAISTLATLSLSPEQRRWLLAHPTVRIGWEKDWAPYDFLDESGKPTGMVMDYLEYFQNSLGIHFEIVTDRSWNQMLQDIQVGDLDMLAGAWRNDQRELYMEYVRSTPKPGTTSLPAATAKTSMFTMI